MILVLLPSGMHPWGDMLMWFLVGVLEYEAYQLYRIREASGSARWRGRA
jgi:hypothetical protein